MQPHVKDLNAFYTSDLGALSARLIADLIGQIWPDVKGMSLMGLGYPGPYLLPFLNAPVHRKPERVIALMHTPQGVVHWPASQNTTTATARKTGNLTCLTDELQLPLPDASMDRIILTHVLENTEQTRVLLREIWRVLAPGGRVLVLAPNRRGLWAPFDKTPFGTGRPYSRTQLFDTLADSMLTPTQWHYCLHLPPFSNPAALRLLGALETPGKKWWRKLAGLILMEAEKQIYAKNPDGLVTKRAGKPAIASATQERRSSSRSPS